MKRRIYIAGPLFSKPELDFNEMVDSYLAGSGYSTFLPQRDGYLLSDLVASGESKSSAVKMIFEKDLLEIQRSDILVCILDGRVPDEGACVELGIAYALGKECIGLKTDTRCLMDDLDNPLITGTLKGRIARSIEELKEFLL